MSNQVNSIVKCTVTGITAYGAFVKLEDQSAGLIHISEISRGYLKDINSVLKVGDIVNAKVLSVDERGRISLSIKALLDENKDKEQEKTAQNSRKCSGPVSSPGDFVWESRDNETTSFEEMMTRFKRTSEEKIAQLKRGENRAYSRKRGNRR